jgi:hypothetical protein
MPTTLRPSKSWGPGCEYPPVSKAMGAAGSCLELYFTHWEQETRFATAYKAVLQMANMAIACADYYVVGQEHHITTFEAAELAMSLHGMCFS